jgi:hypothetical protein
MNIRDAKALQTAALRQPTRGASELLFDKLTTYAFGARQTSASRRMSRFAPYAEFVNRMLWNFV